jgi:hypothetical protein
MMVYALGWMKRMFRDTRSVDWKYLHPTFDLKIKINRLIENTSELLRTIIKALARAAQLCAWTVIMVKALNVGNNAWPIFVGSKLYRSLALAST